MSDFKPASIEDERSFSNQVKAFGKFGEFCPVGLFQADAQGFIIEVTPRFCALTGLTMADALGSGWQAAVHSDDRKYVRETWGAAIKGRRHLVMEFRLSLPDGTSRWVLCEVLAHPTDNGRESDFSGALTDISSQKDVEQGLAETENQFRYIVKYSPFSIAVFDKEMNYLAVSDRYVKDFYYGDQSLIGKNHYDVTPGLPQRWRDFHARCLNGAVESAQDDMFVHQDGSIDYINWECRPWFSAGGSVGGIVLFTEIVTQRKQAEDALRQSEERYRNLIETSPDSIAFFDLNLDFSTTNRQTALMHGFDSVAEMFINGRSALDFLAPEDCERFIADRKLTVEKGEIHGAVYQALKKDGSRFFIEINASTLYDAAGKPIGITSVARDISGRIEAEKIREKQQLFSTALHESALAIGQSLDLPIVLEQILTYVTTVVDHDAANIMLIDEDVARVVGSHGYGDMGVEEQVNQTVYDIESHHNLREMAATGNPYLILDVAKDKNWRVYPGFEWIRSFLSAPIKTKDRVVGFINLDNKTPNFYHPIDAQRLQAFADQAAAAIENANLYQQSKLQAEENSALYRASMPLLKPGSNIRSLAAQIAQTVTQEFSRAHVGVLLVDENERQLKLLGQAGYMNVVVPPLPLDGGGLTVAAFNSGEIIFTPDTSLEPRYVCGAVQSKSELDIPLKVGDHILGVLNMESPVVNGFSDRDRRILTSYADRAALALENALLFTSLNRHVDQLAVLNNITRTALEEADLSLILQKQTGMLMRLLEADGACITLWDTSRRKSSALVYQGTLAELAEQMKSRPGEPTFTSAVLEAQNCLVIRPEDREKYLGPRFQTLPGLGIVLALPLTTSSQKIGAALLSFSNERRIAPTEITLAEQACGQIALTIAKAQLLEVANRRAYEAENLRLATTKLASTLSMENVLESILEHLKQVIDFDSASVYLLKQKYYEISASTGYNQNVNGQTAPLDDAFFLKVTETKKPLILADAAADPNFKHLGDSDEVRGWMCIPLIIADEIIGFLTIDSFTESAFDADSMNIAKAYADQASIAVQNARLYDEEQSRARELEGLHNATMSLVSSFTDIKALLERILNVTARAIPATDKAVLFLKDSKTGRLHTRAEYGYNDAKVHTLSFEISEGYPGIAASTCQAVLVDDTQDDNLLRYKGEIEEARQVRSSILAPLISEHIVLGVIALESLKPGAYTESDLRLLTSFASTATAALRNAQLHAEVQELAVRDPLTGLLNRRGFFEQGLRELVRAQRGDYPLSVIMVDADRLKKINDTYGHAAGDRLLKLIAEKFTCTLRKIDLICRYGGDEFALLLPDTDLEGARDVAERLTRLFEKTRLRTDRGEVMVSISMGIAQLQDSYTNLEGILMQADEALYRAKSNGRGCFCLWDKGQVR